MNATTHLATPGGVSTRGEVRPTRRDIERHVLANVVGISRAMANRVARTTLSAADPYTEAVIAARQRMNGEDLSKTRGPSHADPTGEKASARADRNK